MKDFFFNTIQEFNDYIGVKTLHPLVSVPRVKNTTPIQDSWLYRPWFRNSHGGEMRLRNHAWRGHFHRHSQGYRLAFP